MKDRKQRLRTLENQIRKNYESFVHTGIALREIRDDELYLEHKSKEGEPLYPTWTKYLKEKVGEEFGIESRHAQRLVQCAEIRPKLDRASHMTHDGEWSQAAVREFARLAPDVPDTVKGGLRKDYVAIDTDHVQEAVETAKDLAGDKPLTSGVIRQAIDKVLGVDRAKKSKATKAKREKERQIEVADYLRQKISQVEGITAVLSDVPAESWELLEQSDAGLADELADACDVLAGLLRS